MTKVFATAALALALNVTAFAPSFAQMPGQGGPMMGMMGGGCMMGQNMMGSGMMGQGMMRQGQMGQGQMGQGQMGQGQMGAGGGMGGPGMMRGQPRMAAMVDGRLAYLKTELGITEAQADAWNGYAEAIKGRVETMRDMRESMMEAMQKGTAPERMAARIGGMEAMLESMKAVQPATEQLYSALTDDQKGIADQLIGMDCGAM
ncbi:Spy/CpxP family protein refolding chaperone [Microbaculum marinisediminis]|uniref:Spy/CpxP family protein refolding chaperone n=1 Tax=Microbaculum marinisediminis TaxID=2931392 RepID=A0AAW5QY67_9HYPH|nr:Spy/CpxP family protein refolding chaperone [Microbaculum sp. A6E488]MCT8971849.1 Spy/CpxP family protein refolding chaperone [Microbaculum sp. A6E488]